MADFESKSATFLDWFKSQPGSTFDSRIKITDLRSKGEGRGIIATEDIPAETELFNIPRSNVISIENSQLSKKLPNIFSTLSLLQEATGNEEKDDGEEAPDLVEMPDPWLDLILVMIYEFLQGRLSPWQAYLDVLPDQFDTLMFWTPEEVKELQSSAVKDRIGKESADEMFQTKVLPLVREHKHVFCPEGVAHLDDAELMKLAHRMGSIIMAYAFDLDQEDEDEEEDEDGWTQDRDAMKQMGMVPMADMLNADAEFNAHLNHEEDKLSMTSLREIKAGEEILNYYGPLPNCDLLRRYGYTSAKHRRYDVVELPWDLVKKAIDERFGRQGSPIDDEDLEEGFVLERESGDPDETGINTCPAEFVSFPEELEDQIQQFIPKTNVKLDKAQKKKLKRTCLEIIASSLAARLKQYETTIEQDQELLRDQKTSGRLRMAVDVRLGEKRLLQEAQVFANNLMEKYSETVDGAEASHAKKQKRN
ncbi:hypothetical protein AAFC00_001953 [Neodothiora populina]|uniref:Ribosomal lysine N-methyltransferase 4 n=1 Tax=Neodothiora populina TaxID=2781224 RepID=A0ABR3PQN5_9PEZI